MARAAKRYKVPRYKVQALIIPAWQAKEAVFCQWLTIVTYCAAEDSHSSYWEAFVRENATEQRPKPVAAGRVDSVQGSAVPRTPTHA